MTDHGTYSAERACPDCDYRTLSRDEFWQHRATHDERVERIYRLLHDWAYLISREQIQGVLNAIEHIEKPQVFACRPKDIHG
jgi:tRNA G26 N,N-dimethylase Trm1